MATSATATAQTTKLPKEVFGVEVANYELLKLAYEAYLANGRTNLAKTLRRGEVSGGGRKPHRQKGTGRARVGSSRTPLWRHGGVIFGPLGNENYRKELSTSAKRTALRQALSLSAKEGRIVVIDELKTTGKTKEMVAHLTKHGADRTVLLVVPDKTAELIRSSRNLQDVTLVHAHYLNVFNVLNSDKILITKKALEMVNGWLGAKE
ncbi:MAG TPA: 50S ribosomal protein L4 [Candidatus Saccharimonadales bacterium]|nr:50S ribosomal protein L4 [Candidatus Saccharimonadales bacterium]